MVAAAAAQRRRRRDELVWRARRADGAAGVFAEAAVRLRRLVPYAAAAWVTTDPGTGLPTGPTLIEDLDEVSPAQCSEHWRHEFVDGDVNLFRDLARADVPAGALRAAVGDPSRSARYRAFVRPLGFEDELRAVLRVGDVAWGAVTLFRKPGEPAFDRGETELVASLSDPLGEAIRASAQPTGPLPGLVSQGQPGLMLFDADGELVSISEQARAWLEELPADQRLPTALGVEVPMWLMVTMFHARAATGGDGDGTARARARSLRGTWLVCHAMCLHDGSRPVGQTAVVIEPARPAEIAPIIIDAYELTPREQDITQLIARGASTSDIAGELHLSTHTVRDHVKEIFRKVDVNSRGELVARLFAEHYKPAYLDGATRVTTGAT
jgi:DNA-binding CsgD family transcriptional regulator